MTNSKPDFLQRWGGFVALCLLALIFLSQLHYDIWANYSSSALPTSYNNYIEPQPLSGNSAKLASFGQTQFLANLYWLELIQYYGGGDPNGKYRKLPDLYNTITDLDPQFLTAYQNGLLVLPGEGFVDQAIALGKKGEQNLPNSWEIPYYLGLDYHIYKKDYIRAAAEFTKAAQLPGAPANTQYFVALYYNQANETQISYQIFKTVYDTTTDSYLKDRAQKYMVHLQMTMDLQNAVATFNARFRRYPASLQELVDKKIISALPVSPLGFAFNYSAATGTIKSGK